MAIKYLKPYVFAVCVHVGLEVLQTPHSVRGVLLEQAVPRICRLCIQNTHLDALHPVTYALCNTVKSLSDHNFIPP